MFSVRTPRLFTRFDRKMTLAPFRAGGIDVECLPTAHSGHAGCAREFRQHRHPPVRRLRCVGEHVERQRLQRIAGEDRGGFVEGDMHGGLAAAEVVVVHRRQVVVDQRIAVDQFDCGGGGVEVGLAGAERGAGGVGEQRAHALAAVEHAMSHRPVQAAR